MKDKPNKLIHNTFKWSILAINAALTMAFGATFGHTIIPTPFPLLNQVLGGFVYVVFLDAAAIAWFKTRHIAETEEQHMTATYLSYFSIGVSVVFSMLQIFHTATTLLSISNEAMSIIGYIAITALVIIAGGHFFGIFYYQSQDPEFKKSEQEATRKAKLNSAKLTHVSNMEDAALEQVKELMASNQPVMAKAFANKWTAEAIENTGYSGKIKLIGHEVHVGIPEKVAQKPEGLVGGGSTAQVDVPQERLKRVEVVEKVEVQNDPHDLPQVPHDSSIFAQETNGSGANFT